MSDNDNDQDYSADYGGDEAGGQSYEAPASSASYYSGGTVSASATTSIHTDGGPVCCNLL